MSIFKSRKGENVPQTVPRFHVIKIEQVNYTQPKLHIPRVTKNGKKVADLSKPWYVWFKFRNPETGKFDNKSKFNCKHGINRYKTYKQRKEFGESIVRNYTKLLAEGYNPFFKTVESNDLIDFSIKNKTVLMAVETALKEKQNIWAVSTSKVATFRIQKFIEFLKQQHIAGLDSRQLTRIHVTSFLKKLQEKGESQTSVNNYRAALSGIFSQMVENNHIEYNYVKDIKKTKSNPIKNHPFTNKQILDIKTELEENDPYLLLFLRVLAYSFLRNLEVIRLRVKDIDLRNRLITDQTKTRRLEKIFITDNLMEIFRAMELENYDPEDFVFSLKGAPGIWETSEKGRYDYFSKKFKRIKKKLGLGPEYGIYSFRHSFAINVYEGFEKKGLNHQEILLKMLPITRHKSKAGLENYLREKKQMLPKDYSENISIDF